MKTWELGTRGSSIYRFFDAIRNNLNHKLSSYLYSFITDIRRAKVIEAGSGPGYCASLLNRYSTISESVLLDIDPEVIQMAGARDSTLKTTVGNLLHSPFFDNSFDLVYNSSTIEHIPDLAAAFSEMARICRPGGIIFIGIPCKYGPLFPFSLLSPTGSIGIWIGRFIPRHEILLLADHLSLNLIGELFYFYRFFHGYLFQKTT